MSDDDGPREKKGTFYRFGVIELATSGRANCQNPECFNSGTTLQKGEIRFGTWVEIQGHGSWKWRHWGCVGPTVIEGLKQSCGDDTRMIDGYEDMPPDFQAKIVKALEQGHVDDEDWKGDIEKNRPGERGFRKVPVKKIDKKKGAVGSNRPPHPGSKEIPVGAEGCLSGLTFVFTGTLDSIERDEAEDLVKKYGARTTKAPSKKTSYVVLGTNAGDQKLKAIESLSIKTLTEDDLLDLIRTSAAGGSEIDKSPSKKRKLIKEEFSDEDEDTEPLEKKRKVLKHEDADNNNEFADAHQIRGHRPDAVEAKASSSRGRPRKLRKEEVLNEEDKDDEAVSERPQKRGKPEKASAAGKSNKAGASKRTAPGTDEGITKSKQANNSLPAKQGRRSKPSFEIFDENADALKPPPGKLAPSRMSNIKNTDREHVEGAAAESSKPVGCSRGKKRGKIPEVTNDQTSESEVAPEIEPPKAKHGRGKAQGEANTAKSAPKSKAASKKKS